jgi:hypothetical protein
VSELEEYLGRELDVEQVEDESPDGCLVVVCRDHAERSMKEGDRGEEARMAGTDPVGVSVSRP